MTITIKLVQCRTNKMVADALTKNLPAPAFDQNKAVMLGEDEAPFTVMMCLVYVRDEYPVGSQIREYRVWRISDRNTGLKK
jgi:hypothetical protein